MLFCSGRRNETSSRLHWAVFLPVEDGGEDLEVNHGKRGHSLILHGQFFLDAGRKKIHDQENLHQEPELLGEAPIDEGRLRRAWNQRLAQEVVLPLVLPTLEDHVGRHGLSNDECRELTGAISKVLLVQDLSEAHLPRWCLAANAAARHRAAMALGGGR